MEALTHLNRLPLPTFALISPFSISASLSCYGYMDLLKELAKTGPVTEVLTCWDSVVRRVQLVIQAKGETGSDIRTARFGKNKRFQQNLPPSNSPKL